MSWCFDPHSELHKNYFQMDQEDLMKEVTYNGPDAAWRESLEVGDKVNVRFILDDCDVQLAH